MEIHLRTTGCRLPYGITLPATRHKRTHSAQPVKAGTRLTYPKGWKAELPRWLVTYRDGLPSYACQH